MCRAENVFFFLPGSGKKLPLSSMGLQRGCSLPGPQAATSANLRLQEPGSCFIMGHLIERLGLFYLYSGRDVTFCLLSSLLILLVFFAPNQVVVVVMKAWLVCLFFLLVSSTQAGMLDVLSRVWHGTHCELCHIHGNAACMNVDKPTNDTYAHLVWDLREAGVRRPAIPIANKTRQGCYS